MSYILVLDSHRLVALSGLACLVLSLRFIHQVMKAGGIESISPAEAIRRAMPPRAGMALAVSVVLLLSLGIAQIKARPWTSHTALQDCWASLMALIQ